MNGWISFTTEPIEVCGKGRLRALAIKDHGSEAEAKKRAGSLSGAFGVGAWGKEIGLDARGEAVVEMRGRIP